MYIPNVYGWTWICQLVYLRDHTDEIIGNDISGPVLETFRGFPNDMVRKT